MSWRDALTESQRAAIVNLWNLHPSEGCRKIAARASERLGRPVGETTCKKLKPHELRTAGRKVPRMTLHARGCLGRAERNDGAIAVGRGLDTSSMPRARQDSGEIAAWIAEDRKCRRRLGVGRWRKVAHA